MSGLTRFAQRVRAASSAAIATFAAPPPAEALGAGEQPPIPDEPLRDVGGDNPSHSRRSWYPGWSTFVIGLILLAGYVLLYAADLPERLVDNTEMLWRHAVRGLESTANFERTVSVAVSSPSVQTRERLINDRFEQVSWTELLLKSTRTVTAPGLLMPEELRRPQQVNGNPDAAPGAAANSGKPAALDPPGADTHVETEKVHGLSGTSTDDVSDKEHGSEQLSWFNRMRSFRDMVRNERADAMLDDRHDLDDNTLYNFAFDTAVVPEPGVTGYAVVQILLTNDPRELTDATRPPATSDGDESTRSHQQLPIGWEEAVKRFKRLQRRDIFDIYLDWLERTKTLINENIADLESLYMKPGSDDRELYDHMLAEACGKIAMQYLPKDVTLPEAEQQQKKARLRMACQIVVGKGPTAANTPDTFSDQSFRDACQLAGNDAMPETSSPCAAKAAALVIQLLNSVQEQMTTVYSTRYDNEMGTTKATVNDDQGFVLQIKRHLTELQQADLASKLPSTVPGKTRRETADKSGEPPVDATSGSPITGITGRLSRYQDLIKRWQKNPEDLVPRYQELADYCFARAGQAQGQNLSVPLPKLGEIYSLLNVSGLGGPPAEAGQPTNPTVAALSVPCPAVYTPIDRLLTLDALIRVLEHGSGLPTSITVEDLKNSKMTPFKADRTDLSGTTTTVVFAGNSVPLTRSRTCLEVRVSEDVLNNGPIDIVPGRGGLHYNSFFQIKPLDDGEGHCALTLAPKVPSLLPGTDDEGVSQNIKLERLTCDGENSVTGWVAASSWVAFKTAKRKYQSSSLSFLPIEVNGQYFSAQAFGDQDERHFRFERWQCNESRHPEDITDDGTVEARVGSEVTVLGDLAILLDSVSYAGRTPHPMTQAFPYGLSPRSERTHDLNRRNSSGLEAVLGQNKLSAQSIATLESQYDEEPIVGYIPHLHKRSGGTGKPAEFGWIISPRVTTEARNGLPLEVDQLGALVAVPSWWRTALIRICAAAVKESELPLVVTGEFWPGDGDAIKCRVETLRLPGTGSDVSRHLGIEVLSTPYVRDLSFHQSTTRLRVGDPGKILLQGGRLWRNTVVTLGGQRADQITVLPNLQGIIAEFLCIEEPEIKPGGCQDVGKSICYASVPIQVWTSEGESIPVYTEVVRPKGFQPCKTPSRPIVRSSQASIDFRTVSEQTNVSGPLDSK